MSYSEEYDAAAFKGHLTHKEFYTIMDKINDTVFHYGPCGFCWCIGYMCCPITLGLSLCLPAKCIDDAEEFVRIDIRRFNNKFSERGVRLYLRK